MKIIKSKSLMHQLKNIIQGKKKKNEEEVEKNKLVQDNKDEYRID